MPTRNEKTTGECFHLDMRGDTESCYICGRNGYADPLNRHEVFYGNGRRPVSIYYGCVVWVCHFDCHQFGSGAIHNNEAVDDQLKRECQQWCMDTYGWTIDNFIAHFGCNYL